MIPFLLGVASTLGLMALVYLVFRSRRVRPKRQSYPAAPRRVPLPNDLLNLESAIDVHKVLAGVAAIKKAEEARKRGA